MKKNYKTKQKQIIEASVRETSGAHFTVEDIFENLKDKGYEFGKATVYRHINELAQEGILKKYNAESGRSACFEHIDEKDSSIYHFKCTSCNKLIHVDCPSLAHVKEHLLEDHGFMIDTSKVVFVGECEACRKNKKQG